MSDLKANVRRYTQYTLYCLSIFVLGWGFTDYQALFLGLIFGTLLSLFNLWNLYRKTVRLGQAAIEGTRAPLFGTVSRLATGAVAALAVINFPETFHIVGVIIGLMLTYIIILIDSLMQKKRL